MTVLRVEGLVKGKDLNADGHMEWKREEERGSRRQAGKVGKAGREAGQALRMKG